MNKAYQRINGGKGWKDYSSDDTPLNAHNLNHMEIGIDEIDNRVIILDETKAAKLEISEFFKEVSYDERTGIITFTRKNGATITIDTPMEKIQTGIYYNPDSEKLVLPLIDGTSIEVDLSRLMKFDEFIDSETIAFSVKPNGLVTAIIKEGSIEEKHLRPDYLTDIRVEEAKAQASADAAAGKADEALKFAKTSESFAHGGTGSRDGEETDNAEYYSNQAKSYYENLQQSGNVTGVKGNAESSYRKGNVNITPANIGLGNVNNTADSAKNVSSAKLLAAQENNYRQGTDLPSTYPRGVTVFLSDNPTNKFNGITYCTIHTIKGYTNMACIQFLYPYNTNHDKIYFREALYNSDSWRPWYEVVTSANIGSQSVNYATSAGSATKATQDGSGNVIKDTYAKKSIYGDDYVSMGRKAGATMGKNSFAFGYNADASGNYSHAEGSYTIASAYYSHVEGNNAKASGEAAHAEGAHTIASAYCSHAEGSGAKASGNYSHAEGRSTEAGNCASHVSGKYSKTMVGGGDFNNQIGDVFVIGNGTADFARSNALRVTYAGDVMGTKAFQSSGADYAEHFEKKTGIGEDWVGHFVTIKDGYIYKANEGDYILGIVSGNPSIIGNSDEDYYWRYERDEFNRIVMEDVPELIQKTDEDGNVVFDEETHEPIMIETGNIVPNARMKLAEGYDPTLQDTYIPREKRDEWECVGMLGVIPVRDDGTCIPGRFCKCGTNGIATLAGERGYDTFFVIERKTDNIVSVVLK